MSFRNALRLFVLLGVLGFSVQAFSETRTVKAELLAVSADGKNITFKDGDANVKSKISGSRTSIMVKGAKADRKALKAGMRCNIKYTTGGKNEPAMLDCR